eukprot:PhM_4_TR18258/c0_g1_i1/m.49879
MVLLHHLRRGRQRRLSLLDDVLHLRDVLGGGGAAGGESDLPHSEGEVHHVPLVHVLVVLRAQLAQQLQAGLVLDHAILGVAGIDVSLALGEILDDASMTVVTSEADRTTTEIVGLVGIDLVRQQSLDGETTACAAGSDERSVAVTVARVDHVTHVGHKHVQHSLVLGNVQHVVLIVVGDVDGDVADRAEVVQCAGAATLGTRKDDVAAVERLVVHAGTLLHEVFDVIDASTASGVEDGGLTLGCLELKVLRVGVFENVLEHVKASVLGNKVQHRFIRERQTGRIGTLLNECRDEGGVQLDGRV